MFIYCVALSLKIANPGNIAKYRGDIILQAANVGIAAAILLHAALTAGWSWRKDSFAAFVTASIAVSLAVRSGYVLAQGFEENMTNAMVRWDSSLAAVSSGLVLCMLFYRTFSSRFRYGFATLQAALLVAFVIPAIYALPAVASLRSVDRGVARKSVGLCGESYEVLSRSSQAGEGNADRMAYLEDGDTLYVAFAGTDPSIKDDVLTDLNVRSKTSPVYYSALAASVHQGFGLLYDRVKPAFLERIRSSQYSRIVFCGHSLGGALATIAAADFASSSPETRVWCFTFGSPQVGDQLFVNRFNRSVAVSARFVNPFDVVPHSLAGQYGHVKGLVPVSTLKHDVFPFSHSLSSYERGVNASVASNAYGLIAPALYVAAGYIFVIVMRFIYYRFFSKSIS